MQIPFIFIFSIVCNTKSNYNKRKDGVKLTLLNLESKEFGKVCYGFRSNK